MGNEAINKFHKGLLWSLFLLIPLVGPFVYIFKVVNAGMGGKNANRWVGIYILWLIVIVVFFNYHGGWFLIIRSFLSLAWIITFWVITVKSIGWRFFAGSLILQILLFRIAPAYFTL